MLYKRCETHALRPQCFRLGAGAGHASPRGYLDLDRLTGRVRRGNREIRLGPTDFRLLEYLLEKPGRVFSRARLLDLVWGRSAEVDERTVDVHIGRLRKRLSKGKERDPIRTVRGAGYAIDESFGRSEWR
jgi:two-component system, OmpR family, phosphate regulon response regulator PhoB